MESTANKGWTIFGKKYHRAEYAGSLGWAPPAACRVLVGFLDQTVYRKDGQPTGALVPTNLRPCKRCFPNGDV
jgi:hypothetical protein